jgi:hypothetical protein
LQRVWRRLETYSCTYYVDYIDVVIAQATVRLTSTGQPRPVDGAACAAAEKNNVAKYKEVMRLSPTAQLIPFIMEANGRLGKEAQKLLIALSCAIPHGEQKSRRY